MALHELRRLIDEGLTDESFQAMREYLLKNVFVTTKTQDQQLGYALDSAWYGIPEFTSHVRDALASLTVADVNDAIRRHLSADDLFVTCIAGNAEELREELLAGGVTTVTYEAPKPDEVTDRGPHHSAPTTSG
ncbi:MAG: hypothetical protein U5Q44_07670 [Dehalococcoidia bacterium]|nr:hypothetical protein [Dehalococcoidia bacterium]